jgi:hypothetical protein
MDGGLAVAIRKVLKDIERAKFQRTPSSPLLGISVTASCRVTGLPAVGFDAKDLSTPLSRMVKRWRDKSVADKAKDRWRDFLPDAGRFGFPVDLDDLGRTHGDTSLVGVVHVDGNGIGRLIADWLQPDLGDNAVVDGVREWSAALDKTGRDALRAVVTRIVNAIDDKGRIGREIPNLAFDLVDDGLLPIRPVILGGDDLTFLCDGRIALDLAATTMSAFETTLIPHLGNISACAGVAIVPSHAPFNRAYELAESLTSSAKRGRSEKQDSGGWIDWHIGAPQPGETVASMRSKDYAYSSGGKSVELTCRPYRLGASPENEDTETWAWLSNRLLGLEDLASLRGPHWRQHRGKVKEIARAVREGPEGVRRTQDAWTTGRDLALPGSSGFFDASRTPLLDAIELLYLHLPLAGETA